MYQFRTNPPSRQIRPTPMHLLIPQDQCPIAPPTLLMRVERFLTATGMAPSRFGREVAKRSTLVTEMRQGAKVHPSTVAKIEAVLARGSGSNA